MQSIRNFRDLGGIPSKFGTVKNSKLMRGGPLNNINQEDSNELINEKELSLVVDFRNSHEIQNERNQQFEGVTMKNIIILKDDERDANPDAMVEKAAVTESSDFMFDIYDAFISDENAIKAYKDFIEEVAMASEKGSVYFHCTAGKDRTGFASALLLKLIGVEDDEILKDFLKTNENVILHKKELIASIQKFYPFDESDEDLLMDIIGVREDYLAASFNAITSKYGDFDTYVRDGLQLSEETLKKLRDNLIQ